MREDDEKKTPAGQASGNGGSRRTPAAKGTGVAPGDAGGREEPRTPLAARQERALALLCQGLRPPAIAQIVGASPATVRRWLRKRFDVLAREAREEHAAALLRAIESQREIARAAWEAYANEREVEAAILRGELDHVRRRATRRTGRTARGDRRGAHQEGGGDTAALETTDAAEGEEVVFEEYERPRHPGQGARYLSVAVAAQREMARMQGLYEQIAQQPAEISITITRRPDGPENLPPGERLAAPPDRGADEDADDEAAGEREGAP